MTQHKLDWSDVAGLNRLVNVLSAGEPDVVRLVGGCVRDRLLRHKVADIDLATKLLPQVVMERLRSHGINCIPTGLAHGTVTAIIDKKPFEITTLRRDEDTDGRRAKVAFTDDWAEDAKRRDFTINALYSCAESGTIFDYTDGLSDLSPPHVRFIGDAHARIAEDNLRILRYFRFLARFGEQVADQEALTACKNAAASLRTLSRERVWQEWGKLLSAPNPNFALSQMDAISLFAHFLPECVYDSQAFNALIDREQLAAAAPAPLRRFSALLPMDEKLVRRIASRLKMSKKWRDDLGYLVRARLSLRHGDMKAKALAYRFGNVLAHNAIILEVADNDLRPNMLHEISDWHAPKMPISGRDLLERGMPPGPEIANMLKQIETDWIEADFCTGDTFNALVETHFQHSNKTNE